MAEVMIPGDIIRTSYGTGPYVIIAVHHADDGSISLTMNAAPPSEAGNKKFWINGLRKTEDGRWLAYGRDEIFIVQQAPAQLVQLRLF